MALAAATNAFAGILRKEPTTISVHIDNFNRQTTDQFYRFATSIGYVRFAADGTVSGSVRNAVGSPDGRTASGIMYKSDNQQIIYKQIEVDTQNEDALKEFFLEAFIAVVLSTQPVVGTGVCVPTRVFRSDSIKRSSSRFASAASGASATGSLYLRMDIIPYTFHTWGARRPQGVSVLQHYQPIIRQLAQILGPLERDFRFCHNDLHASNFLITEAGEVRLIDFGRSSVILNDQVYGHRQDNLNTAEFEFSCDMLIFLISLYSSIGDAELRTFIRGLFTAPNGNNLLDFMLQLFGPSGNPLHFYCYPYEVWGYGRRYTPTWTPGMRQMLRDTPSCCRPDDVLAAIDGGGAGAGAGAGAAVPRAAARAHARPAAPHEIRPLVKNKNNKPGCCSRQGQSGCVICGGGKKRRAFRRLTKRKTRKSRSTRRR